MKKCIAILVMIVMFWLTPSALATDITSQIDYSALEAYAESWNAKMDDLGVSLSLDTSNEKNYISFSGSLLSPEPRKVSIIDSLSDPNVPADLLMQYFSDDNSVALIFGAPDITEIPKSIEIYADGINCGGSVEFYPAENEEQTDLYVLVFDLANISTILNAQDTFMRLVTEGGTYFQEMDSDSWLAPYLMWSIISEGINYSNRTSEYYLDSSLLGQEPETTSQPATTIAQTHSFQTDYEAIDRAAQSVFLLEVYDDKNQVIAIGSGFVAFDSGTLITNEHVIEDAAYIIAYSDQYKTSHKLLNLKAVDKNKDIAILEFDLTAKVNPLPIEVQNLLLRGQPVTAIGSPKGVINTVSSGNISNIVNYSEEIHDCIQFTAPISPGSSGGALFDKNGAVVGLCVSSLIEGDAMYYAIPMKYVEELYLHSNNKEKISLADYNGLPSQLPVPVLYSIRQVNDCIELNWKSATTIAEAYEIYRRTTENEEYTLIATVKKNRYSDPNVVVGQSYEYYVRAIRSWYSSASSNKVSLTMVEPTPTPSPKPTPTPTLTPQPTATPIPQGKILFRIGNSDDAILDIKCKLAELGYYSIASVFNNGFDSTFKTSITNFQKKNNLEVTGVIDETTLEILNSPYVKSGTYSVPSELKKFSKREYKKGESGEEILQLKENLKKLGYYRPSSDLDNEYNSTMVERVKQFQSNNNLEQTGIINHVTLIKIYSSSAKRGEWYVAPTPKPTPEKAVMLELTNAQMQTRNLNGNQMQVRVQLHNASSKRTIVAYELYAYTLDVWGNRLIPADKVYIFSAEDTINPGEKCYSEYLTLDYADQVSSIYIAINKVKYSDRTIETVTYPQYLGWGK